MPFDDVRIPVSSRIGAENEGWTVAKSLLSHERLGAARASEIRRAVERARTVASEEWSGNDLIDEDWFARRLWTRDRPHGVGTDHHALRGRGCGWQGAGSGDLAVESLWLGDQPEAARDLLVDAVGYYGLPYEEDAFELADDDGFLGPEYAITLAAQRYSTRGSTIAGGGSREVQAMVTAKRVLGL